MPETALPPPPDELLFILQEEHGITNPGNLPSSTPWASLRLVHTRAVSSADACTAPSMHRQPSRRFKPVHSGANVNPMASRLVPRSMLFRGWNGHREVNSQPEGAQSQSSLGSCVQALDRSTAASFCQACPSILLAEANGRCSPRSVAGPGPCVKKPP